MGTREKEHRVVEEPARPGNPFIVVPGEPVSPVQAPQHEPMRVPVPKEPVKVPA